MTLDEMLKQKAELERQIAHHHSEARDKAISEIRSLMSEHGLTAADIAAAPKRASRATSEGIRKPVAAKYKDKHGNSWTGRGLKPKWLTAQLAEGKKIEDFAV